MELIIIPALTTIALFVLQAREYFAARNEEWSVARYPAAATSTAATSTAAAPPVRRALTPYVVKQEESAAERAA